MNFKFTLLMVLALSSTALMAQKIDLKVNEAEKKVDVLVGGKLFTSYIYPGNIMKPVLWPVN